MEKLNTQYVKMMEVLYQYSIHNHLEFIDYKQLDESLQSLCRELIDDLEYIDFLISSTIKNYTIDRLNLVDLAIIRVAVFSILKALEPAEIIINQAVEMTKTFSDLDDEKQHKFNNSLIDNIYKKIK